MLNKNHVSFLLKKLKTKGSPQIICSKILKTHEVFKIIFSKILRAHEVILHILKQPLPLTDTVPLFSSGGRHGTTRPHSVHEELEGAQPRSLLLGVRQMVPAQFRPQATHPHAHGGEALRLP